MLYNILYMYIYIYTTVSIYYILYFRYLCSMHVYLRSKHVVFHYFQGNQKICDENMQKFTPAVLEFSEFSSQQLPFIPTHPNLQRFRRRNEVPSHHRGQMVLSAWMASGDQTSEEVQKTWEKNRATRIWKTWGSC